VALQIASICDLQINLLQIRWVNRASPIHGRREAIDLQDTGFYLARDELAQPCPDLIPAMIAHVLRKPFPQHLFISKRFKYATTVGIHLDPSMVAWRKENAMRRGVNDLNLGIHPNTRAIP
jgi:hypothetical protein